MNSTPSLATTSNASKVSSKTIVVIILALSAIVYSMSLTWIQPVGFHILKSELAISADTQQVDQASVYKVLAQVLISASFFVGRVISYKIWVKWIRRLGEKWALVVSILATMLSTLLTLLNLGKFYQTLVLRLALGLLCPLDILLRLCSLDLSNQHFNSKHFHLVNLSLLLGQLIASIFNQQNTQAYDFVQSAQSILTSPQLVIAVLSLCVVFLTLIGYPSTLSNQLQYEVQNSEHQTAESPTKDKSPQSNENKHQVHKQQIRRASAGAIHGSQQPYVMQKNNDDTNSLQLFESSQHGEDTQREEEKSNTRGSIVNQKANKNGIIEFHLDDIDNISDCDVDSIKNTSARAITFNQFELTKNAIHPNNNTSQINVSSIDESRMMDIDLTNNKKMNQSHIELINQTQTEMGSAISSDRRSNALNLVDGIGYNKARNSIGRHEIDQNKKSLFEKIQQSDKNKESGPYARLGDELGNQSSFFEQTQSKDVNQTNESNTIPERSRNKDIKVLQNTQTLESSQLIFRSLLGVNHMKSYLILLFLTAFSLQYIEEKTFLMLQFPNHNGFNLEYQKTNIEYAKISIIPLLTYIPIFFLLKKRARGLWFMRILLIASFIFILIEAPLIKYASEKFEIKLGLFLITTGLAKSFYQFTLFTLYVLGLRLVSTSQRYLFLNVYILLLNLSFALSASLSSTLTLFALVDMLPMIGANIIQAVFVLGAIITTFTFGDVDSKALRSSSSSDVLSGAKRQEQQKQEEQQQDSQVVDPAVNLQYQNKQRSQGKPSKQKVSKQREQWVTNPQQPSEEIVGKLQEEDDFDKIHESSLGSSITNVANNQDHNSHNNIEQPIIPGKEKKSVRRIL